MRGSPPIAPHFSPRARLNSRRAFTLIEILVAAAITALLAGFIFIIVHNVSTTWTRSTGRLGADAQARLVLDQLALDLQGAMFRDDGNVWLAVDVLDRTNNAGALWQLAPRNPKPSGTPLSLVMTAPNLSDARYGQAGVWLRFFTTSRSTNAATASISAPVAVGYQIIRRYTAANPANLNTAYVLNRAESRPGASGTGFTARPGVLESGYNITAAAYTTSSSSTNSGATTGDPRSITVPGSATGVRNLDSILADNVIDFGVRCYVRDQTQPGGLRLIFPATTNGALTNSPQPLRSQLPSDTSSTAPNYNPRFLFPDVVDVMVRVLTDDGAQQIANMEKNQTPALTVPVKYNGNAQQWWWGVAQENSRVYTRRIVLNAKSL